MVGLNTSPGMRLPGKAKPATCPVQSKLRLQPKVFEFPLTLALLPGNSNMSSAGHSRQQVKVDGPLPGPVRAWLATSLAACVLCLPIAIPPHVEALPQAEAASMSQTMSDMPSHAGLSNSQTTETANTSSAALQPAQAGAVAPPPVSDSWVERFGRKRGQHLLVEWVFGTDGELFDLAIAPKSAASPDAMPENQQPVPGSTELTANALSGRAQQDTQPVNRPDAELEAAQAGNEMEPSSQSNALSMAHEDGWNQVAAPLAGIPHPASPMRMTTSRAEQLMGAAPELQTVAGQVQPSDVMPDATADVRASNLLMVAGGGDKPLRPTLPDGMSSYESQAADAGLSGATGATWMAATHLAPTSPSVTALPPAITTPAHTSTNLSPYTTSVSTPDTTTITTPPPAPTAPAAQALSSQTPPVAPPAPPTTPSVPSSGGVNSALSILASEEEALSLPAAPSEFPDLPPLVMPTFQQAVLSNGLRVVMLEDHEVPLVKGSLFMKGGTNASPQDKVGLASIAMAVQRAGGSEAHPGASLDLRLEELAAGVEAGAAPQALSLDFFCSSEDLPEVLGLWAEVLRQPALLPDRLLLYQDQVLNAIEHRNDDATALARRQLARLIYGPTSIYARQPTKKSVTSLTVDDVRGFLNEWERPDSSVLGVVGDFQPAALLEELEQRLSDWKPAEGQPAEPPTFVREQNIMAPAALSAGKVFVVDRPGLTQASVAASEPGVSLMDADAYPLDLLSTTFNSFGGLLFDQIRSREGLAYSVYGAWDLPPDRPGLFVGGGETSSPGAFITGLRRVLQEATQTEPRKETLDSARNESLSAFVFNFASKAAQLQRTLVYDLLGLPGDLLFQYRDGISRVTPADVLLAAQHHLHPDQQVTVVVGDAAQIMPQLEAAGLNPLPLALDDDE